MSESLEAYLRSLRAGLPPGLGTQHTARLLREIEEHILEGCEAEQERGATPADALERTLARLGPPGAIAHGFYTVVDRKRIRRGRLGQRGAARRCSWFGLAGLRRRGGADSNGLLSDLCLSQPWSLCRWPLAHWAPVRPAALAAEHLLASGAEWRPLYSLPCLL